MDDAEYAALMRSRDRRRQRSPRVLVAVARLNGWRPTQSPPPPTIEVADLVNCY